MAKIVTRRQAFEAKGKAEAATNPNVEINEELDIPEVVGPKKGASEVDTKAVGFAYRLMGEVEYQTAPDPEFTVTIQDTATSDKGEVKVKESVGSFTLGSPSTYGIATPSGMTLVGYNTASGGTGTAYAVGASVPVTADMTLYAIWETTTP